MNFFFFSFFSLISLNLIKKSFCTLSFWYACISAQSAYSYGSLIWNMIAGYIKDSETLGILKGKIRK